MERTPIQRFAELVQAMRKAQNTYFKQGRTAQQLSDSKALEREVDRRAREILEPPTLFSSEED